MSTGVPHVTAWPGTQTRAGREGMRVYQVQRPEAGAGGGRPGEGGGRRVRSHWNSWWVIVKTWPCV